MPAHSLPTETRVPSGDARIPPAGRASWSGQLTLRGHSVPVKAYPTTVTTRSSLLHQMHAGCGRQIEYRKTCPEHGQVPTEEIVKGYAYAPEDLLELNAAELAQLDAQDDKAIHVARFFDPECLDLALLSGRSFHLVPAHPAAQASYAAIAAALARRNVWGQGNMVLSGRRQLLVVEALGRQIRLYLLHWPAQRRARPILQNVCTPAPLPVVRALDEVITENQGPVCWEEFADDWDERLTRLVHEKLARQATATAPRRRSKQSDAESRSRSRQTNGRRRSTAKKAA